ncbi:hypothetical protein KY338_05540 [Candidatus Woesearchaeota archaeon]|nr:hypothetical protein [Candidatus Woesearchaeota archaeon]
MSKAKNYEKLNLTYKHSCSNVQLGIDITNHIVFICNKCHKPLEVIEVLTERVYISKLDKDACTFITLACHNCKTLGHRKFYWKTEDGRFCLRRTYSYSMKDEVLADG